MLKNLFDIPVVGRVLKNAWAWRLLRLAALALLLIMAAYGWHHHGIPGVAVKDPLMYTNLATYFFWVLWMMGVVFLALLAGRAWCSFCPVGWLTGVVARFGLQRPLPAWLRGFLPVTLTLVALQMGVYLLALHRYPDYTASLLALMMLLAVGVGLLFRHRAFCSLFCPAGAVFGLYARVAPFHLEAADAAVCAACESRDCVSGAPVVHRFTLGPAVLFWKNRRNECPVDLHPAAIENCAECSLCLHCAQNCQKGNVLVGSRPWLGGFTAGGLAGSETLFFLVLLGMLTANFSKVFVDLREVIFYLPQQAAVLLGWQASGFYLLATVWVTLVFPLLLVLPGLLVLKLSRLRVERVEAVSEPPSAALKGAAPGATWESIGRLAMPLIPLVLTAHVVLALVKLNAKGAYLPLVLGDPSGVKSYLALNVMNTMTPPGVLIPLDILKYVVAAVLLAGYLLSLLGARRMARKASVGAQGRWFMGAALVNLTLVAGLYMATVIEWLFIR